MKLASNFKPHLIAHKDATRYILQNVCVRHGMSIATDGRMVVAGINEASDDELRSENVLIPVAACVEATKKRIKDISDLQGVIEINESEVKVRRNLDETIVFKRKIDKNHKFPEVEKVMPKHTNPISVTFSAKLLKKLSDAIGEESICLTFDSDDLGSCMIVTPSKLNDRFGLLMPTRFGSEKEINLTKNKALERMRNLAEKVMTD